jgi:hypothetical protein
MAVASYTTDLSTISQAEETSGTWAEPTATGWTSLNSIVFQENEFTIQSTYCVAATLKTGVGGILADSGASGVTIPTDGAFLVWCYFAAPSLLDTEANGGMRLICGSALNAFYWVKIGGKDLYPNPYGGWQNLAMANPSAITTETAVGAPTTTRRYFGWAYNCPSTVPSKGNPFGVDVLRYGRCESRFAGGTSPDSPCTFAGYATQNDLSANRWGLITASEGGFKWRGLMTLGYVSAVDFRDSNTLVLIVNDKKVTSNFSKIEIRQATSRVDLASVSFQALGTVAKGNLEVIDDCDVNISKCTFTDMGTFIFKSASDILNSIFRRCGQITANDANFTGTIFDSSSAAADTSALVWDVATDPNSDLSGCSFTKGTNAHHAIEFGTTSPTSMTLTNVTFTGFNGSNAQNDSAIHIKRTSGEVTITITGGTSPSYKTAGATVTIVTSSRTIKAIVQKADGTKIQSARVFLKVSADASGGFPYDDTVTISNSSTTATVTHTGHGMLVNDKVVISGASLAANNGVFIIATRISDNSYTYTMGSAPGSSPTGTIKASFVFLEGATDSSGELSMSRAIGATQTVTGWARKSSGSPYYKQGPLSGVVSTSADSTFTAILSPDE